MAQHSDDSLHSLLYFLRCLVSSRHLPPRLFLRVSQISSRPECCKFTTSYNHRSWDSCLRIHTEQMRATLGIRITD